MVLRLLRLIEAFHVNGERASSVYRRNIDWVNDACGV